MSLVLALLALGCGLRAAELPAYAQSGIVLPAPAPSASATATTGQSAALAVSGATRSLDAELSLLNGGPLSLALRQAARQGRRLRLLLDPREDDTRAEGAALAALSPSVQVRWSRAAGEPLRWILADGSLALAWDADSGARDRSDRALRDACSQAQFDQAWSQASPGLPEGMRLSDQLHALPDPRVADPHYIRRRQGSEDGEDHADPARTQPAGP
jgi:hypothetical protein